MLTHRQSKEPQAVNGGQYGDLKPLSGKVSDILTNVNSIKLSASATDSTAFHGSVAAEQNDRKEGMFQLDERLNLSH